MTRSDKSQASWGTYCRSYLVTLGGLLGGGASVFLVAHYTESLVLPWQITLLLSVAHDISHGLKANHQITTDGLRRRHTAFVEGLAVKKFHGVGPATAEKMHRLGIETGADLKAQSLQFLSENFGKSGPYFYGIARGIDERQVRPDRVRKSVGAEDTFTQDIDDLDLATSELKPLAEKVWDYCQTKGFSGKTVTVKIKYSDFTQATRSRTNVLPFGNCNGILDAASGLLATVYPFKRSVRLLGITLSSLTVSQKSSTSEDEMQLGFNL